jgi:precorrin-6Y C5,15-methyltransferase (decarboxylating)
MPLRDADFIRGGSPMTKEEIRWLTINKLGIRSGDIVFDIGAGTGSVSIEMARKAYDGFVYAIEEKEDACALVRANADKHGAFNVEIVHGRAPEAFAYLPVPDKAFIGGSSGNIDTILGRLLSLNPAIEIAVNVVTLQSLQQTLAAYEKHCLADTDVVCANIAKSKKMGEYDMMTAQNPVYILTGRGSAR